MRTMAENSNEETKGILWFYIMILSFSFYAMKIISVKELCT